MYLEPEYAKSRITDFGFKELVVLPREMQTLYDAYLV